MQISKELHSSTKLVPSHQISSESIFESKSFHVAIVVTRPSLTTMALYTKPKSLPILLHLKCLLFHFLFSIQTLDFVCFSTTWLRSSNVAALCKWKKFML